MHAVMPRPPRCPSRTKLHGTAQPTAPVRGRDLVTPPRTAATACVAGDACTPPAVSRPPARLHESDLLIPVLECAMLDRIHKNEEEDAETTRERHFQGVAAARPEPSVFHALQPPSITPAEYLQRLARYSFCSRSVFVAAFYYLDRVAMQGVDLTVTSLSVHRLLLTAVLLATKYFDDVLYDNAHFAKVGGLDVQELNMLELDMLKVLDFRLHINVRDFEAFESQLLGSVLDSPHPDYVRVRHSLANLGYRSKHRPSSPTSLMELS